MENLSNYKHSELTGQIIKEAYFVYNYLGFGFLESVYEKALEIRLKKAGLIVKRQDSIKVFFEEEVVGKYITDLSVNNKVIVEVKAVEMLHPKHEVQLVNYLKATEIEIGLLINFGENINITRRVLSNEKKIALGNYKKT